MSNGRHPAGACAAAVLEIASQAWHVEWTLRAYRSLRYVPRRAAGWRLADQRVSPVPAMPLFGPNLRGGPVAARSHSADNGLAARRTGGCGTFLMGVTPA